MNTLNVLVNESGTEITPLPVVTEYNQVSDHNGIPLSSIVVESHEKVGNLGHLQMFIDYRSEKNGYIDLRRTGSSQLRKDSPCGAAWRVKSCPGHKHGRASGTSWRRRETGHLVPKRAGGIIYTSKMDDLSVKKWLILFVPVIYVPSNMGDRSKTVDFSQELGIDGRW